MRARPVQFAAACAVALCGALGGCGGGSDSGSAASDLTSLVPPDVPFYAEAVIRPDGDQREAIESLSSQVAGIDDPGSLIVGRLDAALADEPGDFTYEDDIAPWLGERGAVFLRSFDQSGYGIDGAVAVEVTDAGAAQDFIDRVSAADAQDPGSQPPAAPV